MSIIGFFQEFWWIFLLLIPLYLIYTRVRHGRGIGSFGVPETKLFIFYGLIILVIVLLQQYIFTTHYYLLFFIMIFLPMFMAFIYILLMKDNVFIIENTIDCEVLYDLGEVNELISEATRTSAYMMDREAYKEIRHIGEIDYPYWDGGDSVKFTDYFDQKHGVMFHPVVSQLHNVSFYVAKSFWLKMKQDIPDLIRENTILTWLGPYKTAHEQSKLAANFKLRLKNIERQYQGDPFMLPDDLRTLWEKEIEKLRADREASEVKIPLQPKVEPKEITNAGDSDNSE